MKEKSNIDFSRTYDVYEKKEEKEEEKEENEKNKKIMLLVHGGGSHRAMWGHYVKRFQHLFKLIAVDLPAHASRLDEELTVDSACKTVEEVLQKENVTEKIFYFGISLGAYLGMSILGRMPEKFYGAVIADAGQNTGVGSGFAAQLGLFAMDHMVPMMSAKTLVNGLVSQVKKNGHIEMNDIDEYILRAGFFFQHNHSMIHILKTFDGEKVIPKIECPILYVNGLKDHHDSQDKWVKLTKNPKTKLITYKDGDHFFISDTRYQDLFCDSIIEFERDISSSEKAQDPVPESEKKE